MKHYYALCLECQKWSAVHISAYIRGLSATSVANVALVASQ